MILTGRCKEDFLKWKAEYKGFSVIEVLDFNHLSKVTQNSVIVEFLAHKILKELTLLKIYFTENIEVRVSTIIK